MKNTFILMIGLLFPLMISCKQKPPAEAGNDYLPKIDTLSANSVLRKAAFMPYWVSNAQFAGYYMAKEMGIYKKYGIDLEIIPYEPFYTTNDLIRTGKVDFTAFWLINGIKVKDSGIDIVNIAQFSTRSSLMLVTKKSSGINKLEDMDKKKAGIWVGFELPPKALFKKYNLNVEIIPIGSTNNLFLKDGVDITNANWFDEYHSIINSGYDPEDLNIFFFADYGLNFLEDGIYCLSQKMKDDPQLCIDFVNATKEGWKLAFENPEKAVDIVVEYSQKAKLPVNRVHQLWMIERYKDLYYSKGEFSTTLSEKDYYFTTNILKENGLISKIQPFENFFIPYNAKANK